MSCLSGSKFSKLYLVFSMLDSMLIQPVGCGNAGVLRKGNFLIVRRIEEKDIDRLLWIEAIVWRNGVQFKEVHFRSQLKIFPEGQLCFEDEQGRIWGFVNLMKFKFDPRVPLASSWSEITADGCISSHDPGGNWLFGVNLSVHTHGYFSGAVEALLGAAARTCIYMHLKGILFGGRMPGYARWLRDQARTGSCLDGSDIEMARSYMKMRVGDDNGITRRLDPELDLYEKFGMSILGPVPKFMPDEKSLDFGVALVWSNVLYFPFYLCPSQRAWEKIIFGPVGRLIERTYLGLVKKVRDSRFKAQPFTT